MDGQLQRRRFGSLHHPLEAERHDAAGTIKLSNPSGKYGIGGSVKKGKIKFGAVSVGAKYKGTFQRDVDVRHLDEP